MTQSSAQISVKAPLLNLPWAVTPDTNFKLSAVSPDSTPAAPGDRAATEAAMVKVKLKLAELQNRLRAEEKRSVLLLLQGMDASGKDGTAKAVFSAVNPMGVRVASFNVPTEDELSHDFLWRIHKETPPRGHIGIFNRSQYEDILAVRVRKIAPEAVWRPRYELIREFERNLTLGGTLVLKVMLHISKDEQARRLQERIDDPTKRWKFRLGDLDDRKLWPAYQRAYDDVLDETSTPFAPWFVVPADRKWYRNYAVLSILTTALETMDPKIPLDDSLHGTVVDRVVMARDAKIQAAKDAAKAKLSVKAPKPKKESGKNNGANDGANNGENSNNGDD
jgi:PPK2 family polyphosphate:nucleotide phosphotransferase